MNPEEASLSSERSEPVDAVTARRETHAPSATDSGWPVTVAKDLESSLKDEYRRIMRWYPKQWRLSNEEAMLGTLLDQADSEGRDVPTAAERSAIFRAGLGQRFGFPRRSSSPLTLAWGGAGLVLGTLMPLLAAAVFFFPVPYDYSWMNYSSQPFFGSLSAIVVAIACVILTIGIGKEKGIAGNSIIGKLSLILFPVASLIRFAIIPAELPGLGTSPNILALYAVTMWSTLALGLVALIIASIAVLRAGVLQGLAQWGLLILAFATACGQALAQVAGPVGEISVWFYPADLLIQMSIGVLYILQARNPALKLQLPADEARA